MTIANKNNLKVDNSENEIRKNQYSESEIWKRTILNKRTRNETNNSGKENMKRDKSEKDTSGKCNHEKQKSEKGNLKRDNSEKETSAKTQFWKGDF